MIVRCPKCTKTWDAPFFTSKFFNRYYLTCGDCWKDAANEWDSIPRKTSSDGKTSNESRSGDF